MSTVVMLESMFGNTEKIARAVAAGIRTCLGEDAGEVRVLEIGEAPAELSGEVGLLIVGGPTHAFGMTRPVTRKDARRRGRWCRPASDYASGSRASAISDRTC